MPGMSLQFIGCITSCFALGGATARPGSGFACLAVINGVFMQETFKVAQQDDQIMLRTEVAWLAKCLASGRMSHRTCLCARFCVCVWMLASCWQLIFNDVCFSIKLPSRTFPEPIVEGVFTPVCAQTAKTAVQDCGDKKERPQERAPLQRWLAAHKGQHINSIFLIPRKA